MNLEQITRILEHMLERKLMTGLITIHTKQYVISVLGDSITDVRNLQEDRLGKSPMKSSVLFLFANAYVRVFRNGKVQIPGVQQYILHSTLYVTLAKIQLFFQLYL